MCVIVYTWYCLASCWLLKMRPLTPRTVPGTPVGVELAESASFVQWGPRGGSSGSGCSLEPLCSVRACAMSCDLDMYAMSCDTSCVM